MREAVAASFLFSHLFFVFVVNAGTVAAAVVEACTVSVCGVSQFLDVWFYLL